MLEFVGERIVPDAPDCEPNFNRKMFQEHIARYRFAAQFCGGKRVLDVGCGVGYGSEYLAKSTNARIVAFDIFDRAIDHAKEYFSHPNVEFNVGDAEHFEYDEKFDVVVCFELIEHVNNASAVIRCIAKALKPNGLLIISTPRALDEKRTHFHTKEFSYEEFDSLIGDVFNERRYYFENNHFTSVISEPGRFEETKLMHIAEEITEKNCDYFIVQATFNRAAMPSDAEGIMVVNDDKYILNLEKDVDILHKAEDELKKQKINIEEKVLALKTSLDIETEKYNLLQAKLLDATIQLNKSHEFAQELSKKTLADTHAIHLEQLGNQKLTSEVAQYTRFLSSLKRHFNGLEFDNESDSQAIIELILAKISQERDEQTHIAQSLVHAERNLAAAQDLLKTFESTSKRQIETLSTLEQQFQMLEKEKASYESQVTLLTQQNIEFVTNIENFRSVEGRLRELVSSIANELATVDSSLPLNDLLDTGDIVSGLSTVFLELTSQIQAKSHLEGELDEIRQALQDESQKNSIYKQRELNLELLVKSIRRDIPDLTKDFEFDDSANALASIYLRLVEYKNDEIRESKNALEQQKNQFYAAEGDLINLKKTHYDLKYSLNKINSQYEKSIKDVDILRNAERNHLDVIAAQEARIRAFEHTLASIKLSTSWKLSAPIRLISKALSLPARLWAFQRLNGKRALIALLRRRLLNKEQETSPGNRNTQPVSSATHFVSGPVDQLAPDTFDLIMLIGCWEGESKRYRVYNVAEALTEKGWKVKIHPYSDLRDILSERWTTKCIVFFRCPYEPHTGVSDLIAHARKNDILTVFDIDDLVFDPSIVEAIHGYQTLDSEQKKAEYIDGVQKYRRLLTNCDLVTVTTPKLAQAVNQMGKLAKIVPNGLNRSQINHAHELFRSPLQKFPRTTVGYFSGSKTHERDFAAAEPALLKLMQEQSDWDLMIVGMLDLGPLWNPFLSRVKREGFMDYISMLTVLSRCHINIAPLEIGDIFCEAKSELKYFEAGLVEVPTIASSTEPYQLAITNNVNGYTVKTNEEWYSALQLLLTSESERLRIGAAAKLSALEKFGPEAISAAAIPAFSLDF